MTHTNGINTLENIVVWSEDTSGRRKVLVKEQNMTQRSQVGRDTGRQRQDYNHQFSQVHSKPEKVTEKKFHSNQNLVYSSLC